MSGLCVEKQFARKVTFYTCNVSPKRQNLFNPSVEFLCHNMNVVIEL